MRIKIIFTFVSAIVLIICFLVINGCFNKSPSMIVNNYLVSITTAPYSYSSELILDRNSAEIYQITKNLGIKNIKRFK
ncbi:MAG: hypothetical protein Q7V36_06345, partial [Deltaproteobacteria bacterium]|nr:hypothetical protein [Deltaproteobacteria bacterium]